ncbi:predicted protein, partial [Nematostella vectensis]
YGLWSLWGSCSKLCGTGTQLRTRICHSRKSCVGPSTQVRHCNPQPCPSTLNGGYSPWGAWSGCDADCGGGVRERTRFCTNPVPGWGGRHCEALGPSKVSELCNLAPC